mgnify:CR=1 FL=1
MLRTLYVTFFSETWNTEGINSPKVKNCMFMRFLFDLCRGKKEQNETKCLTEVTNEFPAVFWFFVKINKTKENEKYLTNTFKLLINFT